MAIRIRKGKNDLGKLLQVARPKTLVEVIDQLQDFGPCTNFRRRDMISACHSVARLSGQMPHDIPADVASLRALFKNVHPVQGRISKKRLSNIRADLTAVLEATGVIPQKEPRADLTDGWVTFLGKATKKHHSFFLSRLAHYCSSRQIEPHHVTDAVMSEFKGWLDVRLLTCEPAKVVRDSSIAFNAIIKRAGLDIPHLTTALGKRRLARRLDIYPQSLTDDIQRYLKRLGEPDLFSDEGPHRALRPTSIRNTEAHIRQALDAALEAGYEPGHFRSLADLVHLDVVKKLSDKIQARHMGQINSSLGNIVATLLAIARYYVKADPQTIKGLELANKKLGDKLGRNKPTMSQKSQRRMDQFTDPANIKLIASLPLQLISQADKQIGTRNGTLSALIAAAIATLLSCPMRINNLASLHMKEDMAFLKSGKNTQILLHIAADKTKGRQAIDAVIEPPYSTIINRYISHHRKHLTDELGLWLFPSGSGNGPRRPDHFGQLIKERVFKETGLVMNVHLFRHFSAYVYLEANPGAYEDVRRVVGHAKMDTTTSFYAPASSKAAYKRYADILKNHMGTRIRK